MVLVPVQCLHCGSTDVIRHGQTSNEKQRFLCRNDGCGKTFIQEYSAKGRLPEIEQRIVDVAVNGSGIRDTARVLDISTDTVIKEGGFKFEVQHERLTTLSWRHIRLIRLRWK